MTSDSSSPNAGPGFHLRVSDDSAVGVGGAAGVDRLTERFGHTVGLTGVLDDLNRTATAAKPRGRAVTEAFGWDDSDQATPRWWPLGITAAPADAGAGRLLLVAWHSRPINGEDHGSRLSVLDLETLRYRHVLLARADESFGEVVFRPLAVNAGGLAWSGGWLHVAGDRRGLFSCRLDDVIAVETSGPETFGYRYLLPVRAGYDAVTDPGVAKMHYSFLSRHDGPSGEQLVVGEYADVGGAHRLVSYALDDSGELAVGDSGRADPAVPEAFEAPDRVRGVAIVEDTWYATVGAGQHQQDHATKGRLAQLLGGTSKGGHSGQLLVGRPGEFHSVKRALPPDPADLTHEPAAGRLWTVTSEPGRRHVVGIDPAGLEAG